MQPIQVLHGVAIPDRFHGDIDQAGLYVAGFLYAKSETKIIEDNSIPQEVRDIWKRVGDPNIYNNVRDPSLKPYLEGFIVGGGGLGSTPLEQRRRPSTRRDDNRKRGRE